MTEPTIMEKMKDIFLILFDQYTGPITPELTAAEVAQWDSLSHVQLIVMVEQAFDVKFSAAEIGDLENLGTLIGLVTTKQEG